MTDSIREALANLLAALASEKKAQEILEACRLGAHEALSDLEESDD